MMGNFDLSAAYQKPRQLKSAPAFGNCSEGGASVVWLSSQPVEYDAASG